jgi:hypothetical protein
MITGTSGRSLGQKLKTAHPRHVDVGEGQDKRYARRVADALKCDRWIGRTPWCSAEVPPVPPKALAKQHLDVRFVIDYENEGLMLALLISGQMPRRVAGLFWTRWTSLMCLTERHDEWDRNKEELRPFQPPPEKSVERLAAGIFEHQRPLRGGQNDEHGLACAINRRGATLGTEGVRRPLTKSDIYPDTRRSAKRAFL